MVRNTIINEFLPEEKAPARVCCSSLNREQLWNSFGIVVTGSDTTVVHSLIRKYYLMALHAAATSGNKTVGKFFDETPIPEELWLALGGLYPGPCFEAFFLIQASNREVENEKIRRQTGESLRSHDISQRIH
jgi:hypothetical protein